MKRFLLTVVCSASLLVPAVSQAYSYAGAKWGVNTIGYDTSGLGSSTWRSVASSAMSAWNGTGSKFQMISVSGSNNTIKYYWDNSDVLAYNKTTRQYVWWGNVVRSEVYVNNAHRFNPPYASGEYYDLGSVLRHELGHSIILNHVSNPSALMYAYFSPGEVRNITSDEVNGARAVYGTR